VAEEPDRLRQEIEYTRAGLTRDVDRLAEKTSPKQVARRRWTAAKEKVMGSTGHARDTLGSGASTMQDKASDFGGTVQEKASDLGGTVQEKASHLGSVAGEKAHDAADAVRSAPQALAGQTQGNPIAAGIIAFGVGMLAATLIPVTDAERRAGQELKDHSEPLTDKAKDVASDLKNDLGGTVQEAAGQLKETAQDAVQTTKDQARSSAQDTVQAARPDGS
jgi:gas vesicle protein